MTQKIINIAKVLLSKKEKLVFLFNFHRIGTVNKKNPFYILHTVSEKLFRIQIRFLSLFGEFVSLNDIRDYENLSKINFSVTFDDGSSTVLKIIPYLREKSIPYAICLSTEVLEKGYGIRDKVYMIINNIDENKLFDFVEQKIGKQIGVDKDNFSFYHITKDARLDSSFVENEIINPLFKTINNWEKIIEDEKPYFSIDDIKKNFVDDALATIVNHGDRHFNMTNSSNEEIEEDMQRSMDKFKKYFSIEPKYYAVPFGSITQNLLINLTNILREYNYQGIMWVNNSGNIIKNKYKAQLLQLTRIHNPTSFARIIIAIVTSMLKSQSTIISLIQNGFSSNENAPKIIAGHEPHLALAFENLVSQGKDYASDIKFYNYLFTMNPYKNWMPDYYAVKQPEHDMIESIGYNFYIQFKLQDELINGVYWRSWRKLPFAMAPGSLPFYEAVKHTPIIAIYKPSATAEYVGGKKVSWKNVRVEGHILNVSKNRRTEEKLKENAFIEVYDSCPNVIKSLLKKANKKYYFSIHRTPEFYKWRYDSYPLAKVRYLILQEDNIPKGYFVTLNNGEMMFISDFFCASTGYFSILIQKCLNLCSSLRLGSLGIETSLYKISEHIKTNYNSEQYEFNNIYAFNEEFSEVKHLSKKICSKWQELVFHETQASGDVLLR
jgi:peptidoglycan/xylan/chitin deacetylase (PgdA/CDA1 family)